MNPETFVACGEDGKFVTKTTEDIPVPMLDDGEKCGLSTLLKYVSAERRQDLLDYVSVLFDEEGHSYDHTFLGFISDYIHYAELLQRKVEMRDVDPFEGRIGFRAKRPPITVYDVGCAAALQHLVFDSRIHYVGIDIRARTKPDDGPMIFRDNCTFIKGKFGDVVDQLKVNPDDVGIANMSLIYTCGQDLPVFDRTFRRKFIL